MKKSAEVAPKTALRNKPEGLPQPTLSENAITVLGNRYLKKDRVTGEVVENPQDLFWRVASSVAAPDYQVAAKFFRLSSSL